MKAYKYFRSCSGIHWAMGTSETIIFIPELEVMLYDSNSGNRKVFGISKVPVLIKEAKEYISKVKSGIIPKTPTINNNQNSAFPFNSAYSAYSNRLSHAMTIPEETIGNVTYRAVNLHGLKEIEIELDAAYIEEMNKVNELKDKYDDVIKNIIESN